MKLIERSSEIETLLDITRAAGWHRYYGGDSREDLDTFIEWANEFNRDWKGPDCAYMQDIDTFIMKKLNDSGAAEPS